MEITNILTEAILNSTPISFSKYGDGEYYCVNSHPGRNCDNDNYNAKKKTMLLASFRYMVDELPNSYIGKWNDNKHIAFWEKNAEKKVKWGKYNSIIMDNENMTEKIKLYKTIKESPLKKILVCNPLLVKARSFLNVDYMIHVPLSNWFDTHFDKVMTEIKTIMTGVEPFIIMTSAGMASKILICELSKQFPHSIYLDFGSAIDKICTKKTSRGWEPSYDALMVLLKDILPSDWNDPKYESIYEESKGKLGIHLPKGRHIE